jgi:ABC-type sugar transport system substrate-binding protein
LGFRQIHYKRRIGMKNKILSVILCLTMVVSMAAGCSSKDTTKETEATSATTEVSTGVKKELVGFAISYTGNDFMQGLANMVKEKFEAEGYECQVASADGDATTQIEQIENFVTMGAKMVLVMAVDPTGLQDVGKKAMESGTEIVAFTTKIEGGETTYVGSASEKEIGTAIATLGSDWVNKTFADAKDGSIETVIFGYSGTPEAADRSKGIQEEISKNTKCKVTYMEPESNTLDAAQQAAENLFQTNPDTKLILCYNSGMSNGVNAYIMSSGLSVEDKATFGSDISGEVMANIGASKTNASIVRGAVSLGDYDAMWKDLWVPCQLILTGQKDKVEAEYLGETQLITADSLK